MCHFRARIALDCDLRLGIGIKVGSGLGKLLVEGFKILPNLEQRILIGRVQEGQAELPPVFFFPFLKLFSGTFNGVPLRIEQLLDLH